MKPWILFGLLWAAGMTVFMAFVSPYLMVWLGFDKVPEEQSPLKIAFFCVFFVIGGISLGYWNYKKNKPKKQIDS